MTREEKITWLKATWLANESNDEVLNQMKWSVIAMTKADNIAMQIKAQKDYDLVLAELKRRLEK